jgi:hypothetical protein
LRRFSIRLNAVRTTSRLSDVKQSRAAAEEDWQRTIKTGLTRARRIYHKAHAFASARPDDPRLAEQEQLAKELLESYELAYRRLS